MGFKAWQHTHPICCNLLFCLPWSAANSLLLSRGPKLRPHGAAYCLHTICSCFRDVRRPQFALFCRLFAIIAWRFIFILEFIHKPFKAFTAILVLTGEVKRRTDASFRVLIRCFSNKLARVIYNLALPAVFGTAWVLEVLRGRINWAFADSWLAWWLLRSLLKAKSLFFLLALTFHLLLLKDFGATACPHGDGRIFSALDSFFLSAFVLKRLLAQAFGVKMRKRIATCAIDLVSLRSKG